MTHKGLACLRFAVEFARQRVSDAWQSCEANTPMMDTLRSTVCTYIWLFVTNAFT
jgi:hypothetical protein